MKKANSFRFSVFSAVVLASFMMGQTVASAASDTPNVTLKIENIKVSVQELEENDYIVEVPVKMSSDSGFGSLQFGISWDSADLQSNPPSGNTPDGISILPIIQNANGFGWIEVFANNTYTGTDICTLQFQVPEDASAGQVYEINTSEVSLDGTSFDVLSESGVSGILNLEAGSIQIVSEEETSADATLISTENYVCDSVQTTDSGDVNMDGVLNMSDLVLINKHIIGSYTGLSDESLIIADLNDDDQVDAVDAMLVLQLLGF